MLRAGEPVLVDIAVCLDGYFADITQQVFLGEPTEEYREAYDVVSAAQAAGVAASVAGSKVEDVASAASAVIAEAGYGEWGGPRTGHGLGADVHEAPSVVEGNADRDAARLRDHGRARRLHPGQAGASASRTP